MTFQGEPETLFWVHEDYYYGVWQNPPSLLIDPGINVAPSLIVEATGASGAVVNYPQTFTTGGADPTASLTYSIPSGSVFPIGTTAVTATAKDGNGNTSATTFNVVVLPAPVSTAAPNAQAVLNADQLGASIGEFVNQVAAESTFAGSAVPVIQQISSLSVLAQQDAATLQPYPAFDQEVASYLNTVATTGLAQSLAVQQQVVAYANMAGSALAAAAPTVSTVNGNNATTVNTYKIVSTANATVSAGTGPNPFDLATGGSLSGMLNAGGGTNNAVADPKYPISAAAVDLLAGSATAIDGGPGGGSTTESSSIVGPLNAAATPDPGAADAANIAATDLFFTHIGSTENPMDTHPNSR